ncbi:hypothetical protein Tco_0867091 [Tanacetum coccineum]
MKDLWHPYLIWSPDVGEIYLGFVKTGLARRCENWLQPYLLDIVYKLLQRQQECPNQDQNLDIPARTLEVGKGYTCPTTHQCDFGESSAPNLDVASKKGKEKLEHFRVKQS